MRKLAVLLLAALPLGAQQTPGSQVTIGLAEYDTLRRAQESPSATVVDTILLSGSFRERALSITFNGRSTGTRPLAKVLEQTSEVTIYGCTGDGIVSRSGKGTFDLIPLSGTFRVECDLQISGSDRLRMHVMPSVLAVSSSVSDGELVAGDEDDTGAHDYTLVRHVAGPGEVLPATATGRYLITLLPDATRFRYTIDVHNPNRTTSTLELKLQSNEHLQQIDSAAPYEVDAGRYVFAMAPGDSTIAMTGELRGTSFAAPVSASLQYLVLESHPLLRPTVSTPAKRISLGETGVTPQYRGAMAFETGTGSIAWSVTRLEALHAISYAVNLANHTLFVPIDGPVLGETAFALRNEGAAELVLPARPEPTYVSFDDEAMLMTKNPAGQLTVPLSPGNQNVLVQHRQELRRVAGFAFGSLAVPQLDVPATTTNLRLTYPEQWVPLYQSFASRAHVWQPDGADFLRLALLTLWIERLLAWLGFSAARRIAITIPLVIGAVIVNTFFVLVLIAFGALTIAFIASQPTTTRKAVYALAIGGLVFVSLLFVSLSRRGAYKYETASSAMSDRNVEAKAPAGRAEGYAYQGLPARFTLPSGDRASFFTQELMRVDRPQTARVLAVSLVLLNWVALLIGLIGAFLLWRERRVIADAIRARLARPTPDPASA